MTQSHVPDPWEAARNASRDDVRAAFAPKQRTCPSCGESVDAAGRRCPHCGADLIAHRPKRRLGRRGAAGVVAVAAVLAAAVAVLVGGLRGDASREQSAAADRQRALIAAERERLRVLGRPRVAQGPARRAGESTLAFRRRLVTTGEARITADARARLRAGETRDPVAGTHCTPFPPGARRTAQEADAGLRANRYECLAYERRFALPELQGRVRTGIIGAPYLLVADYPTSRLTFCRLSLKGGEGVRTLVEAVVPAPCRDPLRR